MIDRAPQVHMLAGDPDHLVDTRAIVAASFAPGAMVSDVARRADISSGQIYRWRQELRSTPVSGFTPVLIATESPATNTEDCCQAAPAIELEFTGKVRVRIPV